MTNLRVPEAASCIAGPLTDPRQVVARGELVAPLLAITHTRGSLVFVTDCDYVAEGWHASKADNLTGQDADA
eukprot:4841819-Pyramimonas_sp.AAC.1